MKFFIDSSNAVSGSSLHLKISGFSIELSDISGSGKVSVIEDSSKVSIEVLPLTEKEAEPFLPAIDNKHPLENTSLHEDVQEKEHENLLNESISSTKDISSDALFKKLVALRRQVAQEGNLPPYIIFHDTTLKDMVSKMPVDLDEMKDVSGIGHAKLQKYGTKFVDVIKAHIAESA